MYDNVLSENRCYDPALSVVGLFHLDLLHRTLRVPLGVCR